MDHNSTEAVSREKLMSDVRVVLADAEQLLRQASAATGAQATELREKAADALHRAQRNLADLQGSASAAIRSGARATDHWVHEHPWTAAGMAAAVGVLLGLLIARR
jgi:ElaB/YqjD/DUF883 family membrane-anchored ribosome-binding protein